MPAKDKLRKVISSPDKAIQKIQQQMQNHIVGPLLSPWHKGRIAMFHIGRSGSTVLTNLLVQHGAFFWDGEIYESIFCKYPYMGIPKDLHISSYDFIKPRLRYAGNKFYGFEVKFFHIRLGNETLNQFMTAMEMLNIQDFIVLKRENFLRKIVSSVIAHEQGRFSGHQKTAATLKQTKIDVNNICIDRDEKPLISFLEDFETSFQELDKLLLSKNKLFLTYEADIAPDPLIGYQRICDFTNNTVQPVQIQLSKTNPFPLHELIINFSEVEHTLQNTQFEWMLYA